MPLVNSVQWIGHFRVPNSHFQNEVKLAYVVNGIFGLAAREMDREPNSERRERGRGRKETLPFFPTPSPLFYSRHFSRGLWLSFLVLCSETTRKRLLDRLKLSAKPLWWKWAFLAWEYKKIIFKSKAFHLASVWNRGLRQLGKRPIVHLWADAFSKANVPGYECLFPPAHLLPAHTLQYP